MSALYREVEKQLSHGLLGPLETVDLHDPIAPLHDLESSFQWFSKKANSLKKLKRTNSFRDENSMIEKPQRYQRPSEDRSC